MIKFTGIGKHKQYKKKLITPLNQLPVTLTNWERDILPEHLWIEFLRQKYSETEFLKLHSELCKTLQSHSQGNLAFLGLISDFGGIPKSRRSNILKKHDELVTQAFTEPFGHILKLYPNAPCYWLLPKEWVKDNKTSSIKAVESLSKTMEKLYRSKDFYCSYLRMIPLRRLFEEGKISIPPNFDVDLFLKYPHFLSVEDREKCESYGRSILGIVLQNYINFEWAKYFWRRNFEITPCQIKEREFAPRKEIGKDFFDYLTKNCSSNVEILSKYLQKVTKDYMFDLYSPEKDEVVLGLFSRIVRLAGSIYENPFLWSFDLSRIMLRCLSDTTITFCYLILKNDDNLFNSFIEYGKGKEKLLLLHLQDTHPDKVAPSGETSDALTDQLGGGISPAFVDINLGGWIDVSARDMAKVCDLLDIYRIIYDPTSSDVHGTWTSIKNINLTYCGNPLHRFHRMPQTEQPPLFFQPLEITMSLLNRAITFAQKHWNFPEMSDKLKILPEF